MSLRTDPDVDRCLVHWVSACLGGEGGIALTLDPDVISKLLEQARKNRLEGFLYPMISRLVGVAFPQDQLTELRSQYHHRLVQGFGQLKAGIDLMTILAQAGIPCLGLRGPFTALDAYGDVAARRFFDIDLLVSRAQARQALRLAEAAGHERSTPALPVGFFLRHHLHWQLLHREAGVITDLHWAIDHPYTLYRINYDDIFSRCETVEHAGLTWQQPGPEHQVLISCIHLCKHLPGAGARLQQAAAMVEMGREGRLSHWLDLAILLRRYRETLDSERLWQTAKAWHAVDALAAGLDGAALLAPDLVPAAWSQTRSAWIQSGLFAPAAVNERRQALAVPSRFLVTLARWGGFRASRVADFWTFLKPPDSYFPNRRGAVLGWCRLRHAVVARFRILLAAMDGLLCGIWAWAIGSVRKNGTSHLG